MTIQGGTYLGTTGYKSNCQNCGHPSHCGNPLWEEYRRDPYNKGPEGRIEVCKSCRCPMCASLVGIAERRKGT